jgi:hypothetical protein
MREKVNVKDEPGKRLPLLDRPGRCAGQSDFMTRTPFSYVRRCWIRPGVLEVNRDRAANASRPVRERNEISVYSARQFFPLISFYRPPLLLAVSWLIDVRLRS